MPDLTDRTAIVTGANTALGYQTALALARSDAHVVLAARSASKGKEAIARIRATCPTVPLTFSLLDLASLASVKDFAERMAQDHDRIDLLINNAGIASPPKRLTTSDGFEMQFGVNFLGHFALTSRLLPLLLKARAPRVVSLSSLMHKYGRIYLDDLMCERSYSPVRSYSQSKLATLIFARELQRRSDQNQWRLLSVAAHPGVARTELTNAATAPDVVPGGYYGPTGWGEIKGSPGPAKDTASSHDRQLAEVLWARAESYTGSSF